MAPGWEGGGVYSLERALQMPWVTFQTLSPGMRKEELFSGLAESGHCHLPVPLSVFRGQANLLQQIEAQRLEGQAKVILTASRGLCSVWAYVPFLTSGTGFCGVALGV